MLLLFELLIVAILLLALVSLYIDEYRTKNQSIPSGKMKKYWNGKERRNDLRVDKILNVRYVIKDKSKSIQNTITKNVGSGGICIEITEKLSIETLLGIEIEIPGQKKPIEAMGKLVWINENPGINKAGKRTFDSGIKFVRLESQDKDILSQYIQGPA